MPTIDPGHPAPNFSLSGQHGQKRTLREFRGRPVVIYFYPEDETPLCTNQACGLRDLQAEFDKLGVAVIGISPDTVESHAAFAANHKLKFTLLADVPGKDGVPRVCESFGAWGTKKLYGRIYKGLLRTTYLIDAAGNVARRWDSVKTPGHAERVLAAAKTLLEPPTLVSKPRAKPKPAATKRRAAATSR